MLTNFVGNVKQHMFYHLWKFNLDTLKITVVFTLSFKTIDMVWSPGAVSVEFRDVPGVIVFQCYSLYFNTLFAKYTEVKVQWKKKLSRHIKYFSIHIIKFQSHYLNFNRRLWRILHFCGKTGPLPNVILAPYIF